MSVTFMCILRDHNSAFWHFSQVPRCFVKDSRSHLSGLYCKEEKSRPATFPTLLDVLC